MILGALKKIPAGPDIRVSRLIFGWYEAGYIPGIETDINPYTFVGIIPQFLRGSGTGTRFVSGYIIPAS